MGFEGHDNRLTVYEAGSFFYFVEKSQVPFMDTVKTFQWLGQDFLVNFFQVDPDLYITVI